MRSDAGPAGSASRSRLSRDALASLVVFLVAVPLSLGIALASNAPIMAGMIAAAVGGIVVGALGGAPLQVSGPAAGLTVVVFGIVEQLGGDWRAVCFVTAAAGLVQLALGSLGIARLALAISPAVVHGMLAGIGASIVLGQLHIVLGGAPQASALRNLAELPGQVRDVHGPAAALGLGVLVVLAVWSFAPLPARLRAIPAPLVAVLLGTAAAAALGLQVERIDLIADDQVRPVHEGEVVPGAPGGSAADHGLFQAIGLPRVPDAPVGAVVVAVLTLAVIASVESLLCAVATDRMHDGPRADLDRELRAQGVGNALSGLLGGLPVTGVIVRSSANIHAGAASRASAILHGVWIVVFVAALGGLLETIPKAVLASLLVFVGARLVNPGHIRELARHGEVAVYGLTFAGVVLQDLLVGVGIGMAAAIVLLLRRLAKVHVVVNATADQATVRVSGALTFVGVPRLVHALEQLPPGRRVAVDLDVELVDHAGLEALHAWRQAYERTGGAVDLDLSHGPLPAAAPR